MKTASPSRKSTPAVLRHVAIFTAATFLACGLFSCAKTARPKPTATPGTQVSEEARQLEAWRVSMEQIPLPKKGTFEASYPKKEWREVPSVQAPPYPLIPRRGPKAAFIVGNGNDVAARAPTGLISTATGSFDSVTGVTSESGQINGTGPAVANAYSIQLNTNFFPSTVGGAPACRGWEQFVYVNDGTRGFAFIQYWLLDFGPTSPPGTGWIHFSTTNHWFRNSNMSSLVPNQPITNLANLRLTGTVGATADSYAFSTGGGMMFAGAGDNSVNAAAGWNVAEFCVVGDAGGGQANFNTGSTVVTRTRITYGGTAPPTCVATGFTGETNNLNFGPTAPSMSAPGPALLATESSAGGATSNCMAGTTVGDTHLRTFNGLLYDFQASGDFVLAEVGPDFVVQTRQVSGAPSWPDASVNSAVATRMGKTTVVICLAERRLMVDGKPTDLADGDALSAPGGVDVSRNGNVYFITDQAGDCVRATVNATWIDVLVGLGDHTAKVRGLLANANGNVNQIAARDGTVLTNPFSFKELYGRYGESWRVRPNESLLSACGQAERGNPSRPFYARNLNRELYQRARAVAVAAGVKKGPLLEAATLDVAVIGDKAAQAFVNAEPPVAVGKLK